MFVLFNKDKKFIGYGEDVPVSPNINIFMIQIPEDKKDLTRWKWDGDMLNGKMVKIFND